MKKVLGLILVLSMLLSMAIPAMAEGVTASDIKVGCIFIGDENEGYTANHYNGIKEMMAELGISEDQVIVKWNILEDESAYRAAVDLVEQGCDIIFANSFGHEDHMILAASEYPDVQFCHATGFQAQLVNLPNFHNYFSSIYEARYVSGVVAGMKLNDMIEKGEITADQAKIGYVGAKPFAEVISGFTSFYLGARSVCPEVTMDVTYTGSWGDFALEMEAASAFIENGCVLISQHADTTGAATACQASDNKVPIVGYNISMIATAPDCALTSSAVNWGPYYTYAVQSVLDGTEIGTDWCRGYADGAMRITELNESVVAEGTAEKVDEVVSGIIDGSIKVFDTSTFTVNGQTLEELVATDEYASYAQYVYDGCFNESVLASAPAFDFIIDGVNALSN